MGRLSLSQHRQCPLRQKKLFKKKKDILKRKRRTKKEQNGMAVTDEECYTQLREAILHGEFQPNERLIEMDLTQSLGAGRAAIRTALARLEQEGLVQRERYRGARVRLVSETEAMEILEARAALESLAMRHAALNATADDIAALHTLLDELAQRLQGGDLLGYSDVNARLHQQLLRIAAHETVSRLLDTLRSRNVRFQFRTILVPGRPQQSYQEHAAIVEAVAAHDPDRAEEAMRYHLLHVADALKATKRTHPHDEREHSR
jgi:DNA-binding GntR family transcriptional regulator